MVIIIVVIMAFTENYLRLFIIIQSFFLLIIQNSVHFAIIIQPIPAEFATQLGFIITAIDATLYTNLTFYYILLDLFLGIFCNILFDISQMLYIAT